MIPSIGDRAPLEVWSQIISNVEEQKVLHSLSIASSKLRYASLQHLYREPRLASPGSLYLFLATCKRQPVSLGTVTALGNLVKRLDLTQIDLHLDNYSHALSGDTSPIIKKCILELIKLPWLCPRLEVLRCSLDFQAASALLPRVSAGVHLWQVMDLGPLQAWLQQDAPWSDTLCSLTLAGSKLAAQTYSQIDLIPLLFRADGMKNREACRGRALTHLDLSSTNASDELVRHILTDASFARLKSLNLAGCQCLTDDVVDLLRQAFGATGHLADDQGVNEDGDDDDDVPTLKQIDVASVKVHLNSLDLSGAYLLGIDGLGDYWEDEDEEDQDEESPISADST